MIVVVVYRDLFPESENEEDDAMERQRGRLIL